MPPKATPSAGVKKKIVKTVRKVVPKAKTPLPESTPPATDADASPPAAAAAAAAAAAEPAAIPTLTPTPTTVTFDITLNPSEPAATETPAPETTPEPSEPAATETPAPETTPEPSEPAATETPAPEITPEPSELAAATESPAPDLVAPETTPQPSDPPAAKPAVKTTIVKKVVKKIIVKRVPKASPAADQAGKVEAKAEASPAAVAPTQATDAVAEKDKGDEAAVAAGDGDAGMTEGRRRRKTEIFIGGLDRDAKEEDLRKVFGKAGEIVEVRMMMDSKTGKNKGYAFLRYADPVQAKRAVSEFAKVEVCGKICGAAALEEKDTIFLGNIDKKWKKEDIIKLLQENGIEKIDSLTLMPDLNNAEMNRGFAFLELETNRDAQLAFKKLQRKDVFGKDRNVKVSWAEPLNDPDEEEMQKVKSVYVDGIPSSWDEDKVRESFKKFGEIERIVLARNMQSAKRKDFAFVNYTTREAALSCIESFDKVELTDNGSKVNVKVSLAKPVQKDKQNRGTKLVNKDKIKEKPKAVERNTKVDVSWNKGKPLTGGHVANVGDKKSSTTSELLHVLREQASWKQEQTVYSRGPIMQDYTHASHGGKRPFSALGDASLHSELRGYPRARLDTSFPVTSSSYTALPHGMAGSSLSYYQHHSGGYPTGALSGTSDHSSSFQRRQGGPPYGSNFYY